MSDFPAPRRANRREVFAWVMYDWANSAYSTLLITVVVKYLQDDVFPGESGILLWGRGIGGTMLLSAVLAPVFGAIADANASKARWLAGTAIPGAVATGLMFFTTPEWPLLFAALFLISNLCFELSFGFYNGFLPEIASDEESDRISAWGYGIGYVGGGVALLLVILMFTFGDALGIPGDVVFRKRLALLFTGLWWGCFSIPTFLWLRDKRTAKGERLPLLTATRQGFREVGRTLGNVRRHRVLALFLLAFLIFNDGVQTVISQASVFASEQLHMTLAELMPVILMIQFVALPGSIAIAWLADRVGQKPTLLVCLGLWIALLTLAFFITTKTQFWIMAVVVALVLGGTQSVSRAMMAVMTPEKHTAEFFGFFSLAGKATSMFGPIFFSEVLARTKSPNLAIASLLVFFLLGFALVLPVNVAEGRRRARAEDAGAPLPVAE